MLDVTRARVDFIEAELTRELMSLPDAVEETYSYLINWLRGRDGMSDFDSGSNINLDSRDWLHVGRQVSQLFPAHALKVYQTLLRLEHSQVRADETYILGQPEVLILDDGCGGGAATAAVISLVLRYQDFRTARSIPIYPVRIRCWGIDPCQNALELYARLVTNCAPRVRDRMLAIEDPVVFFGTLPETTVQISEAIGKLGRVHCVLLMMSNIIRPLTDVHVRQTELRRLLGNTFIGKYLPAASTPFIGSGEAASVKAILDADYVDRLIALLVGAHSSRNGRQGRSWAEEMRDFQAGLRSEVTPHRPVSMARVMKDSFGMVNPRESYWQKHRGLAQRDKVEYDAGYIVVGTSSYLADADWQKVLNHSNLRLAWARVRNALSYDMLDDTVEIRLFEADLNERLNRLRSEVLTYMWDTLKVAEMLNFQVPKGFGVAPRPMNLCRLEDQILATAMIQAKSAEYQKAHHVRSYAYGLALGVSEHLYDGWFRQYQRFRGDSRHAAADCAGGTVIETDLASFYTGIRQGRLREELTWGWRLTNSRASELAGELVARDIGLGRVDYGIPQGHIVSGALANIYLSPIDGVMGPGNDLGIEYYRYVDDMVLVLQPGVDEHEILAILDEQLQALGLQRAEHKTHVCTAEEYLASTERDETLEHIESLHRRLLGDVYGIGPRYGRLASRNWWQFVVRYQRLLASVGVFLTIPRLSRKLYRSLHWWNQLPIPWHRCRLPRVGDIEDLDDVAGWRQEFMHSNSGQADQWVGRHSQLVEQLSVLFRDALSHIDDDDSLVQKRSRQRLRFAVHRLGQLGFGPDADAAVFLIEEYPWLVRPRQVCRDLALQGRSDLLLAGYAHLASRDGEEWAYIRTAILKALSFSAAADPDVTSLLEDAVLSARTDLERAIATESLLLLKGGQNVRLDALWQHATNPGDPYVAKNYVLLHASLADDGRVLIPDLDLPPVLLDAVAYAQIDPDLAAIHRIEPDVLRESYYSGRYADGPEEFEVFVS